MLLAILHVATILLVTTTISSCKPNESDTSTVSQSDGGAQDGPIACPNAEYSRPQASLNLNEDDAVAGTLLLGNVIVDELHTNLIGAGLSSATAAIMANSAKADMEIAVHSLTIDPDKRPISIVAPSIVKGAFFSLTDSCAELAGSDTRQRAANTVMTSTVGSLNQRTDSMSDQDVGVLIGSMAATAVEALPSAGFAGETTNGLVAITSGVLEGFSSAQLKAEQIAAMTQTIIGEIIGAVDAAKVEPKDVGPVAGSIIATAINSLSSAGITPAEIVELGLVQNIVAGAVGSIESAGVDVDLAATAIAELTASAISSISKVGIEEQADALTVVAGVVSGLVEGMRSLSVETLQISAAILSKAAQKAVEALPSAGFSSDDISSATAVVVKTGIEKIASIQSAEGFDSSTITKELVKGAMTGTAALASAGSISADQTVQVSLAVIDSAKDGIAALKTSGVISADTDVSQLTAEINSTVSSTLEDSGIEAEVVSQVQNQIELASKISTSLSTVTAAATAVNLDTANGSVTVKVVDSEGQPLAGKSVSLASSRSAVDTITPNLGVSNASGNVSFSISTMTPGTAIFTASSSSDNVTITQTATISFSETTAPAATGVALAGGGANAPGTNLILDPAKVVAAESANEMTGTFQGVTFPTGDLISFTGYSYNISSGNSHYSPSNPNPMTADDIGLIAVAGSKLMFDMTEVTATVTGLVTGKRYKLDVLVTAGGYANRLTKISFNDATDGVVVNLTNPANRHIFNVSGVARAVDGQIIVRATKGANGTDGPVMGAVIVSSFP